MRAARRLLVYLLIAHLPACSVVVSAKPNVAPLAGTTWELQSIKSMDDAVGTTTIADPSLYTVDFAADGRVTFRLNCNRGQGRWVAKADAGDSGQLAFGPIATTRALCRPPSIDERIARDMGYVRSYLFRDGELHMSLYADGGIYTWRRSSR